MPTWTRPWLSKLAIAVVFAGHLPAGTISLGSGTIGVSGGNSDSNTPPAYVTNPSAFGLVITDGISAFSGQQRRNTDPAGGVGLALDRVGAFDGREVTISGTISALTISDVEGNQGGHSQAFAIGLCSRGWRDQAAATYNLNLFAFQPSPAKDGFAGVAFGFKNGSLYLVGYDYDNQPNQIFLDLGAAGLASGPSILQPLALTLSFGASSMWVALNGQFIGSIATSHDLSSVLLIAMGASVDAGNGAGAMSFSSLTATTPSTPGPPAVLYGISGDQQSAAVGAAVAQPLVVGVVDALRNPLAAVTVAFAAGNATLNPASSQTDDAGRASTSVTLGDAPGNASIAATVGDLPPVTFHLTARRGRSASPHHRAHE